MEEHFDVAVIGGGIAGYSAALTAKNLRLRCIWLGDEKFGKKTQAAEYVRNYPVFTGNGTEFVRTLEEQSVREDVRFTRVRLDGVFAVQNGFLLSSGNTAYTASAVILATGVDTSGSMEGEREFLGRGVSYCAVCDGALYRGKTIAVLLASDRFAEEVEYLAGFAAKVHCFCLYPNPTFRAKNIETHPERIVAVEGGARVSRVRLQTGALEVDGVFILRSAVPPSALIGGLKTNGAHVEVDRNMQTNIRGLFAAGDVTGRPYQYVKAAGEGCSAAYAAREYLRIRAEETAKSDKSAGNTSSIT